MSPIVDPAVERYVEEHTTPPAPAMAALADETRERLAIPQMLTGTVEGRMLEMLVWATGAREVLELGTYSGYSALSMAAALPEGGRIVTCEVAPDHAAFAQRHIDASPYADRIEVRVGPALDTVAELPGPFDLVFIDADKVNYRNYYEAVLPKLAPRGLIAVDNTLWSGRVADESEGDESTAVMREFNDHVRNDPRVVSVQLTVRDGVTLIRHSTGRESA
jgi:caffeoyl-CoA O-methyltransferase